MTTSPYEHALHRTAYDLICTGGLAQAHELLIEVLQQDDTDDETWQLLGLLASLQGDAEGATTLLRQAHALRPDRLLTLKLLAQMAQDAGKPRDALRWFRRAEQLAPQDREVMAGLAICWSSQDKPARAAPYFRALANDPNEQRVDFLFNAALFERDQGRPEQADPLLRRVLSLEPAHIRAAIELVGALKKQKKFTEAIALLRERLAQHTERSHWRIELLEALFEANEAPYREEILALAGTDWPDADHVIRAMFVQGRLHEREGKLREAETYLVSLGKLVPDNPMVRNAVGGFFLRHKHYSQAFNHFLAAQQCAASQPRERQAAMFGILRCAYGSGGGQLADNLLDEQLAGESREQRHEHLLMLATLLLQDGFGEAALDYTRQVLADNPRSLEAHELQARLLHDLGKDVDAAIATVQASLALFPRSFYIHFTLALLAIKVGDFLLGRKHLHRALRMRPDHYPTRANLALLYADNGHVSRALALSRELMAEQPDHEMAHQLKTNYALALIARGDVAEGLRQHRVRHIVHDNTGRHALPVVDADAPSLAGRSVLVTLEQGIGDEVLYLQFVQDLLDEGARRLVVEVSPKLLPLFRRSWPQVLFVPRQKAGSALFKQNLDCQIVAGDLLERHLLRHGTLDMPRQAFLRPDAQRSAWWREQFEALRTPQRPLNIGLCWRSSLRVGRREHYWPPLAQWLPLMRTEGINWINLQYDYTERELTDLAAQGVHLHNFPQVDQFNDLDEVAAMAGALDLVISAPVSVPMIAAAVGTPAWVFTPRFSWTLMGTRRLPMMPLFRPFIRGFRESWDAPIQRMRLALDKRIQRRIREA